LAAHTGLRECIKMANVTQTGVRSEDQKLTALMALPEDYMLFNQLDILSEHMLCELIETDEVIVGPKRL